MIADTLLALAPPDWTLTHIIHGDHGDWQVNLASEDAIAIGTGDTIESAFLAVADKISRGKVSSRFRVADLATPGADIAGVLGRLIRPRTQGIRRRV